MGRRKGLRILRKVNDTLKQTGKFVGFHIDPDEDAKLSLLASSKKISKSALIRGILVDWLRDKEVVDAVARQALVVYNFEGKSWCPLDKYKYYLKLELIEKGANKLLIKEIMKQFDNLIEVRRKVK